MNDIFQVFIDEIPQRKHFKHSTYGSARMLGIKRNFRKYAERYGFTEVINDDRSHLEYSYQHPDGRIMSLRFIGKEES